MANMKKEEDTWYIIMTILSIFSLCLVIVFIVAMRLFLSSDRRKKEKEERERNRENREIIMPKRSGKKIKDIVEDEESKEKYQDDENYYRIERDGKFWYRHKSKTSTMSRLPVPFTPGNVEFIRQKKKELYDRIEREKEEKNLVKQLNFDNMDKTQDVIEEEEEEEEVEDAKGDEQEELVLDFGANDDEEETGANK